MAGLVLEEPTDPDVVGGGGDEELGSLVPLPRAGGHAAGSLGDAVSSVFKGLQRPVYGAILVTGLNVLLLGSGVGAMGLGLGIVGIGACYLLCRGLYCIAGLIVLDRVEPSLRPPLRAEVNKGLFAQGLLHLPAPYYLGNLLNLAFMATYVSLDEAESGPYFIGYRLAAALFVLASASQEAVLPALTQRFHGMSGLGRTLSRAFWTSLGITLAAVLVVQVAARPVTVWFFGSEFLSAVSAVRLLAWSAPPLALCGLAHTALLAMERQKAASFAMLGTLSVGAVVAILAVRIGGAAAGGMAPALVGLVSAILLWTVVWRTSRRSSAA